MRNSTIHRGLTVLVICMIIAGTAVAQQNLETMGPSSWVGDMLSRLNYFPIETGNQWIYGDGRGSYRVEVLRQSSEPNGRAYYEVSGFFQYDPAKTRKLRRDLFGQVFEYNPQGEDFLWYRLPVSGMASWQFQSGLEIPCVTGSAVTARSYSDSVQVSAGVFERVTRVVYKSRCADGGILEDYFASGIGLIKRVNNSIAGPRSLQLVSARVGNQVFPKSPFGVELSVNSPVYYNNRMPPVPNPPPIPVMEARLVVHNDTDIPVEYSFGSSQRYDFVIRDRAGKEVWRWSEGRVFLQVMGLESLSKGAQLSYSVSIKLQSGDGIWIKAGFYTLEGYLATTEARGGMQPIGASLRFEIKDIF